MEKRLIQFLFFLLALSFIWNAWNPLWKSDLDEAVDKGSTEKIILSIEKGSPAQKIAEDLDEAKLIVSENSFLKKVKADELDGNLRYGSFVLSPSMTLEEIITILTTEGTGELAFTALEGWTIKDMDAKLAEMGLIKTGEFTECSRSCEFSFEFLDSDQSLEGYLFPDTYFVDSASFSVETLMNQMLQNFENKWTDELQAQLASSGRTLEQVINVAAMVEKEVRTEDDLPIVAGIIWKRLDNDWTLGIDATLLYKDEDGTLSSEDLESDNAYNTRKNTGLPPTPICNPGLASILAAVNPDESDYWFYLTDSEGRVHYATSNEEHEENKAKYLD